MSFAQLFMSVLALQLGTTTRRENLQRRDVLFRRLHRLLVQHRQVPERPALGVSQRHADVTLGTDLLQPEILREFRLQAGWSHAHMTRRDSLARRARKSIGEPRAKIRIVPKGQGSRLHLVERFCDKGITCFQRLRRAFGQ